MSFGLTKIMTIAHVVSWVLHATLMSTRRPGMACRSGMAVWAAARLPLPCHLGGIAREYSEATTTT